MEKTGDVQVLFVLPMPVRSTPPAARVGLLARAEATISGRLRLSQARRAKTSRDHLSPRSSDLRLYAGGLPSPTRSETPHSSRTLRGSDRLARPVSTICATSKPRLDHRCDRPTGYSLWRRPPPLVSQQPSARRRTSRSSEPNRRLASPLPGEDPARLASPRQQSALRACADQHRQERGHRARSKFCAGACDRPSRQPRLPRP